MNSTPPLNQPRWIRQPLAPAIRARTDPIRHWLAAKRNVSVTGLVLSHDLIVMRPRSETCMPNPLAQAPDRGSVDSRTRGDRYLPERPGTVSGRERHMHW